MTTWRRLKLDPAAARCQLGELRDHLDANPQLAEGAVSAFIRARPQIAASLRLFNAAADVVDRSIPLRPQR